MGDVAAYRAYRQQRASELAGRITVHQAAVAAANPMGQPAANAPLILLADGDSWFDYPLYDDLPKNTDVIAQLPGYFTVKPYILNLAHYGDAMMTLLGMPRYLNLVGALSDPKNGRFDAILFSGGGNDLAGDQFRLWLHDRATSGTVAEALNSVSFSDILGVVQSAYMELIAARDRYAPGIPIFTHCYDYAQPNGVSVCNGLIGPWLYPSLQQRGWMSDTSAAQVAVGAQIVALALQQFRLVLTKLAQVQANNLILVPTLGTVAITDWANELHPTPSGFFKIASKFADALNSRFKGRAALAQPPQAVSLVGPADIEPPPDGG